MLDHAVVSLISETDAKKNEDTMTKQRLLTTHGGTLKKFVAAVAGSFRRFLSFPQVFTVEDARALLSGHGSHLFDGDHAQF
jgi:hypothetical protein